MCIKKLLGGNLETYKRWKDMLRIMGSGTRKHTRGKGVSELKRERHACSTKLRKNSVRIDKKIFSREYDGIGKIGWIKLSRSLIIAR